MVCFKIGSVTHFFLNFFCCQLVKYVIHIYAVIGTRPNFPYTKYGGKRSLTNQANVHIPCVKKSWTQRGRIPIDPAILAAIGHRFIATNKENQEISKNKYKCQKDQKPETFCWPYREGTTFVMLSKLVLWVCLLSLNQDIHWREGTTLVMLAKLLLWVCLLSLNQDIHWREGTTLVMLSKLLLWVCLLSLNQDIHWREGTTLVMLAKLLLWVCLLSLNQDIHWREGIHW